jgi:hypothetical protein
MIINLNKPINFSHITKTGGTSIEKVGLRHNMYWGRENKIWAKYCDDTYNYWHTPLKYTDISFVNSYNWFTVVRNPYDRIISELNCKWVRGWGKSVCDIKDNITSEMIYDILQYNFKKMPVSHYIPQCEYIDIDVPIYIIKYENMYEEFKKYMKIFSKDVILDMRENVSEKIVTIDNFNEKIIRLINNFYEEDFKLFGYNMK